MNSRVDVFKRGKNIKAAWDEGRVKRDHRKCGVKGDSNPAKRPEVRKKISESQLRFWKTKKKITKP
jgi:hypothetical protein